ncbi:alpha/beta hydrolase [Hymenobacter lucidus]|uniref:Alpha/beta hydrolase n=1 Tax=Hymenobacter lucidus TaxID=2880930 RepID=A0ABS8AP70_9BACT|nr:alpha/beta fold hydrolase [Hymenobacter lucidus]MCB2406536.1 alpha/beta hydrolase [Hymenobacter lucidus]
MKVLFGIVGVVALLYVAVLVVLYFKQERLLFIPTKLPADYRFSFVHPAEERWITTPDGTRLHGLLFPADSSAPRGIIFYLHGNAGALDSWGDAATLYTRLGYSVFMLDYRGYGKSGGSISSQEQFLSDVQVAYRQLLTQFTEEQIIILGYSLGTGAAAWLAAQQHPRLLLLQAPYFSMRATARQHYPWVPGFIVRYPLGTDAVLPRVKCPVVIFHGEHDEVIDYQTTLRLKALLKPQDQFITLAGAGHNGMTSNPDYQRAVQEILGRP